MRKIKFSKEKFKKGLLKINDGVEWAKDIVSIFNLRKLIIYAVVVSLIVGYGYWKGIKNKPINIDNSLVSYEKEFTLLLDETEVKNGFTGIKKPKNSSLLYHYNWRDDILGKPLKVENIPELKKKLKPYGFENKFISVMGLGIDTEDVSGEAGVGFRYAKLWQIRTEVVATEKGFYPISISYKPDWFFSNTSLNIGVGKNWNKGYNRYFFGANVEF